MTIAQEPVQTLFRTSFYSTGGDPDSVAPHGVAYFLAAEILSRPGSARTGPARRADPARADPGSRSEKEDEVREMARRNYESKKNLI